MDDGRRSIVPFSSQRADSTAFDRFEGNRQIDRHTTHFYD